MFRKSNFTVLAALAAVAGSSLMSVGNASASVIYQDSFNRTGLLNASPTDTAGATWTAASSISTTTTSGGYASLTSTTSMAYLPFTPVGGNVYTLTASLNPTPGTTTNWLAFGFVTAGNATTLAPNIGTSTGTVVGLIERDTRQTQVFNGDGAYANGPTSPNGTGYTTWSITLNTTHPDWTTSFSEVGVSGEGNFQTFTYSGAGGTAPNPAITDIGFGNDQMSGTVQDFALANSVPEPATWGLVAAGGLGMLLLKRRRTV